MGIFDPPDPDPREDEPECICDPYDPDTWAPAPDCYYHGDRRTQKERYADGL